MHDVHASHRKYSDRLAAQFLELVACGNPVTTAAAAIGVTPGCIQLWRRTRPGFEPAYSVARREGEALPALPDGPCLARWERLIAKNNSTADTNSADRRTFTQEEINNRG